MVKSVAATMAALAIAGSSIVYAQPHFAGSGDDSDVGARFEQHYRPSVEDIKAFTDARIAALKAGLQLTSDQEKNWSPFEQALRDLAKLHLQRVQQRQTTGEEQRPADPFVRLQRCAETMSQFGAALKHVADTGEPLYQSLTDAQKHRFMFLAHVLRPHSMAGASFCSEHRRHGMMGRDSDERRMPSMMRHGRPDRGMMREDSEDDSEDR